MDRGQPRRTREPDITEPQPLEYPGQRPEQGGKENGCVSYVRMARGSLSACLSIRLLASAIVMAVRFRVLHRCQDDVLARGVYRTLWQVREKVSRAQEPVAEDQRQPEHRHD